MQQIPDWLRNKHYLVIGITLALSVLALGSTFIGETSTGAGDAHMAILDDAPETFNTMLLADAATAEPTTAQPVPEFVVVYISGAVQHPDVYQVPAGARVKDVVLAAGGLTGEAAAEQINLAEHVADAQHVHIPRQGEETSKLPVDGEHAISGAPSSLIDLNTASVADLDTLDGIGQSIAERIVEYRTTNGPFQSVEDLQKVKGIGPALFAKISSSITVGP